MSGGAVPAAAEIIIVDANVIINVAEGNADAAVALMRRMKSGAQIYIARAAYNEVISGAATPDLARQYDAMLRDAKIGVAPELTDPNVRAQQKADRMKFYEANWAHEDSVEANKAKPKSKQRKNMVGAIDEYGSGGHGNRPGDAYVAAETKTLKGRLWTFDGKTRSRAANLGVDIAPESTSVRSIQGGADKVDINRARRWLGVPEEPAQVETPTTEARVNAAARPTAAKRLGLRLRVRVAGRAIVSVGAVALSYAAAIGLHFLERWMMGRALDNKLKEALEAAHAEINKTIVAQIPEIIKRQLKWYGWETMFAQVHLEVHNVKRSLGPRLGGSTYQDVEVKLVKVSLSNEDYRREWTYDVPGGKADARIYSFEVAVFTSEEIAAFKKLSEQRHWNNIRLEKHPADEILNKRREFIRQDIINGFGREIMALEESYNPIQAEIGPIASVRQAACGRQAGPWTACGTEAIRAGFR